MDFESPEEIDSHVAGMTDEEVRQAYAQKLKAENATKIDSNRQGREEGTWIFVSTNFYEAARGVAAGIKKAAAF